METGISINKHIYKLLNEDEELNKIISHKCYPIVAEESTTFPFVIFKRSNVIAEYTKDGNVQDTVDINIAVAAVNYNQTVAIAERIREILELRRNSYFNNIILTSVFEDYVNETFTQELTFKCTLK